MPILTLKSETINAKDYHNKRQIVINSSIKEKSESA